MKLIILFLSVFSLNVTLGQCNCQTKVIYGVETKICNPSMVGNDDNHQVALSLTEAENDVFLIVTVRFRYNAKTIGSDLFISTNSKETLNLKLLDSQKDYVGGSEICHGKFKISKEDINVLKSQDLAGLRFHFSGEDLYRTFGFKMNEDVMKKQLKCLNK